MMFYVQVRGGEGGGRGKVTQGIRPDEMKGDTPSRETEKD